MEAKATGLLSKINAWALGITLLFLFNALSPFLDENLSGSVFTGIVPLELLTAGSYLLLAVFAGKSQVLLANKIFMFALCGLTSVAVAIICAHVLGVIEASWALSFAYVPIAIFQGFLTARFLELLAYLEMTAVVLVLAISHVFASLTAVLLHSFSSDLLLATALVITPLLAYFTVSRFESTLKRPDEKSPVSRGHRKNKIKQIPYRPLIMMIIVTFAVAYVRRFLPIEMESLSFIGVMIGAVLAIVVIYVSGKVVRFKVLYITSLFFLIFGLFFLALGDRYLVLSSGLANAGYVSFSIFAIALLCNACHRFNISPYWIFGITYAGSTLAFVAGRWLGSALIQLSENSVILATFGVALILVVVFFTFLTDKDYRTSWGTLKSEQKQPLVMDYYYSLADMCSAIAQQYGLTQREEEVLVLLAQRKTASDIERELYISNPTVKTHTQNIYRKLGIHKKTELLNMIGHPSLACVEAKQERGEN